MKNTRFMYLRPGNLFKEFVVESNKQVVTSTGRVANQHTGDGSVILKGCLAAASDEDRENHSQKDHVVTHTMLGGIEGIMNLAAASGESLGTTSDIVTDALTAFNMKASDAGHFSDVLAAASSAANTNVGMMGETFKYAGSMAGSLGYSIEDVGLAIGLMANNGIKASMGGTALNSIMTRLATDAGASSKKLGALGTLTKKLGVEFYDAHGNATGGDNRTIRARYYHL